MTPLTSEHLRGAAASIFISAIFALAWGLSGSFALPGSWRVVALVLVILLTLLLGTSALQLTRAARQVATGTGPSLPNPFRTTAYRLSVLAMVLAFPIAGRLLNASGRPDAVMPVVAILVGLHFLGLIPAFRSPMFGWVALAFCLVGGVGLLLPVQYGDVALRQAVVGLGCAAVLWLGVVPLLLRTRRALIRQPGREVRPNP